MGRVLAQVPAPTTPVAPDAGPPAEAPRTDEGQPSQALKREELTPAEMNKKVDESFKRIEDVRKRMAQLEEVARREKDVIKLNCVADKLLQLKELTKIAEIAKANLQEAVTANDEEARYHEFGRVTISTQQAQVLGSEAEACIGEDLTFVGPTKIESYEPAMPDDPTITPPPDFPTVEPLPVASPQR